MTSPTVGALLDSLAHHMHNLGIAVFDPDGEYPPTTPVPAIYLGQLADTPTLAVAINHYGSDPDIFTQQQHPLMRVQLRWRGDKDPCTVHHLADAAFAVLHTLTPGPWPGGMRPQWVQRTLVAPIEPDQNGRWMRCDSYEIRLNPGA